MRHPCSGYEYPRKWMCRMKRFEIYFESSYSHDLAISSSCLIGLKTHRFIGITILNKQ